MYRDVVIIGGGITGLSAAYYLQETAVAQNFPLSYTLLEQGDRWGGKICTEHIDGFGAEPFIIEGGPDSFITQKPWAWQLARELGLETELLPTNDAQRKVFVLNKGRPTPLPDGVMLIVPTSFKPFMTSSLISPLGKLRMGFDLVIPPKTDGADETLAAFIERRLGKEALDKIAEPLMSGIYNADAQQQSLLATFPRFRTLEEKHGSLIKGMLAGQKARKAAAANSNCRIRPPSVFVSIKQGMTGLVTQLRETLTGDCRLNSGVRRIEQDLSGSFLLTLQDGSTLSTGHIILAVPAYIAARLVNEMAPEVAQKLLEIRYVSTGTMSLAFRKDEIEHSLDGFGVVIPRSEGRQINAITWTSTKFNHRAPAGYVLMRVFFGGSRTPHMMELDDTAVAGTVRKELHDIMGIDSEPVLQRIYRWPEANPQYDVGHLERVATIEDALPPGLFVTGSPYRGVGIPDCVRQAKETAVAVAEQLQTCEIMQS